MAEQKDVHSSPAKTPKLQLTAEQPLTGECWIPPKKDTPCPRAKELLQQDGRRGKESVKKIQKGINNSILIYPEKTQTTGHLNWVGVVYSEKEKVFQIIKQKHTKKSTEMEKNI